MKNLISEQYRGSIFNSDFEYFVHIRRTKGIFGFRREKKVNFPLKCAYCGSPAIDRKIEIGKPEINLFTGIGKVPYCKEHAEPIYANILHQKNVYVPLLVITITLVFYSFLFQGKINKITIFFAYWIVFSIATFVANAVYIIKRRGSLQSVKNLGRLEDNAKRFVGVTCVYYDIPIYTLGFRTWIQVVSATG